MSREVVETIFGFALTDDAVRVLLTSPNVKRIRLINYLNRYQLTDSEKSAFLTAPKTELLKDVARFFRETMGYDLGENEN